MCVCAATGDPRAGEPGGDVHHPGGGRLTAMHPGSVPPYTVYYHINMWPAVSCDLCHFKTKSL